jgi:hypothetical protein
VFQVFFKIPAEFLQFPRGQGIDWAVRRHFAVFKVDEIVGSFVSRKPSCILNIENVCKFVLQLDWNLFSTVAALF